jgi:hypothetical protein
LAIQVADLDVIVISDCQSSAFVAKTHQTEQLDEFAPQGTSSHHETAAF